jgi:hypothetical protein
LLKVAAGLTTDDECLMMTAVLREVSSKWIVWRYVCCVPKHLYKTIAIISKSLDFSGCKWWLKLMPEAKPYIRSIVHFFRCVNTGRESQI